MYARLWFAQKAVTETWKNFIYIYMSIISNVAYTHTCTYTHTYLWWISCFYFCIQWKIYEAQELTIKFNKSWHDSVVDITWMLSKKDSWTSDNRILPIFYIKINQHNWEGIHIKGHIQKMNINKQMILKFKWKE